MSDNKNGSAIITRLERTWAAIAKRHPELTGVVFITGKGTKPTSVLWGHHAPGRWKDSSQDGRLSEIFVSGECLAKGPEKVLETLIHEAAHNLARARDAQDTSRQGRYHNKVFAGLAEEMGLLRPEVNDKVRGTSACTITEETKERYAKQLELLAEACALSIDGKGGEHLKPPPKPSSTVKVGCDCTDARVSRSKWEAGEVALWRCPSCDTEIEEKES